MIGKVSWPLVTSTVKAVALLWPSSPTSALKSMCSDTAGDQREGTETLPAAFWELLGEHRLEEGVQHECIVIWMRPLTKQLLKAHPELSLSKGKACPRAASESLLQSLVLSPVLQAACNEHADVSATCSDFKGGSPNQLHLKKLSNFFNFFFLKVPCQVFWNESWGRTSGD